MKSDTKTIISGLRILAQDIHSEDGVANAALVEAAERLEELDEELTALQEITISVEVTGEDYKSNHTGYLKELNETLVDANETINDLVEELSTCEDLDRAKQLMIGLATFGKCGAAVTEKVGKHFNAANAEGVYLVFWN